jgi:hypothetical protein
MLWKSEKSVICVTAEKYTYVGKCPQASKGCFEERLTQYYRIILSRYEIMSPN